MPPDTDPGLGPSASKEGTAPFSVFLAGLEEGVLHGDLSKALVKINEDVSDLALNGAKKVKATLTITVDFLLEGGVWEIKGDYKTKIPSSPRGRTMMWSTAAHNFTHKNPRQTELFRDVTFANTDGMRAV